MPSEKNLYLVELSGLQNNLSRTQPTYGKAYVVAKHSEEAYLKVKKALEDKKIGYEKDRLLHRVTLLATTDRSCCDKLLYL